MLNFKFNKIYILIVSILLCVHVKAQLVNSLPQAALFSWHSLALTGQQGIIAALSYQNHLPSFGNAYISQSIGFENDIPNYNGAWGISLNHDALGSGISTNSQLKTTYCYDIKLRNKQQLAFGLRMGFVYSQLNATNALKEVDEYLPYQNTFNVLTEVGGAWISPRFGIALSARSPDAFFSNKKDYYIQPSILLFSYFLSNRRSERDPLYTQQILFDIHNQGFACYTSSFEYHFVEIKSSINYPFYTKSVHLGVGIGVNANRFKFRYFYNHPLGELLTLPFDSHQIMLLITFKNKQRVSRY